ncbi:MAG: DUF5719 family protein [Actinomycetota bacterium]
MRSRGAFLSLVVLLGLVVGGAWFLDQRVGLHPARALAGSRSVAGPDDAPSGAWYCPHGGGVGWRGFVAVTNPGDTPVSIRVRSMSHRGTTPAQVLTVPPRGRVAVDVASGSREAATEVEYFGGWVAAGWVTTAGAPTGGPTASPSMSPSPSPSPSRSAGGGGGESGSPSGTAVEQGVAAESCANAAGRTWYLPDGTTTQGQEDYVVVMNPFGTEAVFRLRLVAEGREVDAGDLSLPAGSSMAVHVNHEALGEQTVAAVIQASIGRVAAASLGIVDEGGIRSAIGVQQTITDPVIPSAGDAGGTEIPFLNPAHHGISYGVDFLSHDGRHLALPKGQRVGPDASRTETLTATGPGAVSLVPDQGAAVAAARRTLGLRGDQGATPALAPAPAWLLTSPAGSASDSVQIALANPGTRPVTVTLTVLGGQPSTSVVTVPPDSSVAAPLGSTDAQASVVATAPSGTFLAVETSTQRTGAGYAASAGVPIPPQWVPR